MNPAAVRALGLPTRPYTKPFRIIFAIATSTVCTHYANFRSILGKVAIVDTAPPDTLLSVSPLTAHRDDSLIFTGTQDAHTRLFHFDIQSLLSFTLDPPSRPPTELCTPNRLVKQPRLNPNFVKEVVWLHKRTGPFERVA